MELQQLHEKNMEVKCYLEAVKMRSVRFGKNLSYFIDTNTFGRLNRRGGGDKVVSLNWWTGLTGEGNSGRECGRRWPAHARSVGRV